MKTVVAPIHISPTKPLVPNHVRHLIYADLVYKGTSYINPDTEYAYNRLDMDVSNQVVKFAAFLDKTVPVKTDYKKHDDEWVGEKYKEAYVADLEFSDEELSKYKEKAEKNLKGYPFYQAILSTWEKQHRELCMYDPGFNKPYKYTNSISETLSKLEKKGFLLDVRNLNGGIYADCTELGLPLRKITDNDIESYNYVFTLLRNSLFNLSPGDTIVFLFDDENKSDYMLVKKVLESFKINVELIITRRISLEGKQLSSRKGGWEKYTLGKMLKEYKKRFSSEEIALGMRLYYMSCFRGQKDDDFSYKRLSGFIKKAKDMLKEISDVSLKDFDEGEFNSFFNSYFVRKGYVDPIRLTEYLFRKKSDPVYKKFIIERFYLCNKSK